ncbi:MAG: hypothetical protein GY832_23705 [Chloroflexi bacterium]|nr:hypothetical protein [Chloroflexota bacterium]
MLRIKPSESIDVVCVTDPALREVQIERMRVYEQSRNIEDLGDFSKLKEQPTVWELAPLGPRFENFLDTSTSDDKWFVFRHNAKPKGEMLDKAGNSIKIPTEEVNGKHILAESVREMVGRDNIHELAMVMIQRCNGRNGGDIPFVPIAPGIWQLERTQSNHARARIEALASLNAPSKETAKPTDSK